MACYICHNPHLLKILSLGHQPPSDAFLREADLARPELSYPLNLCLCEQCYLVQLDYVVDPKVLFVDYVYTSGMNNSLRANFKNLVDTLVRRFTLKADDLAIDIGSNDGTLLENYRPHGIKILGIDPSSSTSIAIEQGIPTIVDFFNERVAREAATRYGQARMITATNVFAHVDDLGSLMRGIDVLLSADGVFVSESGYVLDMMEQLQYDAIYHEHLRYYSLQTIVRLFADFGLEVFDVERIASHGGSLRVYGTRRGAYPITPAVAHLLKLEDRHGLSHRDTYLKFAARVRDNQLTLTKLLTDLKQANARIVGIGAPAKGNTLLNSCHIGTEMIDYLVEKSAIKIGRWSPGMHIPVIDEEVLFKDQPEYGLLLSWNLAAEISRKLKDKGYRGRFIIPGPVVSIL